MVDIFQGVIPHISIGIELLGIGEKCLALAVKGILELLLIMQNEECGIDCIKPGKGIVKIPRPKVLQGSFRVLFLAGEAILVV